MIRKRISFRGWVQGVGFRWRARQAANLYGCTGWAENEWDGSVTLELQGAQEAIDRVLLAIRQGKYIRIEEMTVRSIPAVPEERSFHIR